MKKVLCAIVLSFVGAVLLGGCNGAVSDGGDQGGSGEAGDVIASTQANAIVAADVLNDAQRMLDDDEDLETTRSAMLAKLQGKSNVEVADIDESSDVIWADFDNGETQLFAIFDDAAEGHNAETWAQLLEDAEVVDPFGGFGLKPIAKVRRPQIAIPEFPDSSFLLPGSNKAVLANGLTPFHDDWPHEDNRPLIAKMLTDIGYAVEQTELTVELFTHLSDYGVIYTESHGGWRAASIRDLTVDPLDPSDPVPTCFGSPGNQWLLTTTQVTRENAAKYEKDVECRRLMIMNATLRSPFKPTEKKQFYCVTPLFMREYDKKNFPDRTMMFLNSCRGFDVSLGSYFKEALDARCVGGTYVAWTNRVHPVAAFRGSVNLFQLLTGSNEELAADQIVFLEKNVPPINNMSIAEAYAAMAAKGLSNGLIASRGARLFYLTEESETQSAHVLELAPVIADFFLDEVGNGALSARTPDDATLLIGDPPGPLPDISSVSIDIGKQTGLKTNHVSGIGYALKVPVGAEGEIRLSKDGRTGPPMQLITWKPSFVVKGTGPNGLTFTATFLMHGRALPAPRTRSGAQGTFLWLEPMNDFDARFDEASTVTWSVGGGANVNGDQYTHNGGGTQTMAFHEADGTVHNAYMKSDDGVSGEMDFTVASSLAYTTTITANGQQTTQQLELPVGNYTYASELKFDANWTLQSGSTQLFFTQNGWTGDLTWNAASPTPLFEYEKYRR